MKRSTLLVFALSLPCVSYAEPRAIPGLENVPVKTAEMAKKEADAQKAARKSAAPKRGGSPLASDRTAEAEAAAPQPTPPASRAEQK